ncbi:MAG TPA: sulfotransferase, partial [Spirochaetia bacterium]|nr:sulfotransferase [Spirochaetia bacterium]
MMRFDFLMCSERSGSNLITKILDAHPDICGPFPTHMIRAVSLNLYRYADLAEDRNWYTLILDISSLLNNGIARWKTRFDEETLAAGVKERRLDAIIRFIYETEARAHGKKRLFVKENHSYLCLPYILAHFKEARIVYLARDPRDMALTWKEASSAPGGVKSGAGMWKIDQQNGIKAHGFLGDAERIILIRFEDLVTEPEREAKRLCSFLGMDYSAQMLRFHEKEIVQENANRLSSWKDLQKPIIGDNFNLYKQSLSEAETRYVEALCLEEMEYFGYARDFQASGALEELERSLPAENLHKTLTDSEAKI